MKIIYLLMWLTLLFVPERVLTLSLSLRRQEKGLGRKFPGTAVATAAGKDHGVEGATSPLLRLHSRALGSWGACSLGWKLFGKIVGFGVDLLPLLLGRTLRRVGVGV